MAGYDVAMVKAKPEIAPEGAAMEGVPERGLRHLSDVGLSGPEKRARESGETKRWVSR